MADTLTGHEQAGRLIRLTAWISVLPLIGANAAIIKHAQTAIGIAVVFALTGTLIWFIFFLGSAVKAHQNWARIVGISYGILLLFGFPLGTFIGGFIIRYLIKEWKTTS